MRTPFFFISSFFLIISGTSAETLDLETYLSEVRKNSLEMQQLELRVQGAMDREAEAGLIFSPRLFTGGSYSYEKETGQDGFRQPGDTTKSFNHEIGLQKRWGSGTSTRLSHRSSRIDLDGVPTHSEAFWSNRLELRVEQSLWQDFLGGASRAQKRLGDGESRAIALENSFRKDQLLMAAESLYWDLVFASESVQKLKESLERTRAISAWNRRRKDLNLADQGDVLQSEAAVIRLEQSLETSQRLVRDLVRHVNYFRGSDSDQVEVPQLEPLELNLEESVWPETVELEGRADVQAVDLRARLAGERAFLESDRYRPELQAFASISGGSFADSFGSAERQAVELSYPRYEVGVQLSMPLDFSRIKRFRSGAENKKLASFLEKSRFRQELNREYQRLIDRDAELRKKIHIQNRLIEVQTQKLRNEDERFRQGRSSSFQMLTFEEDLAQAELEALELSAEYRQMVAELKLFMMR